MKTHIQMPPREGQTDHLHTYCGKWVRGLKTEGPPSCKTCIKGAE